MSHTPRPRRLGLVAIVLSAAIGLVGTAAAPAQAASFYEGNSPDALWTGNNGVKYRCSDDARTVREAYLPGGGPLIIELRYSPRCRTAWARGLANLYIEVNGYYLNGKFRTYAYNSADPTAPSSAMHWTVMLDDANLLAEACVNGYFANGWEEFCTSRY